MKWHHLPHALVASTPPPTQTYHLGRFIADPFDEHDYEHRKVTKGQQMSCEEIAGVKQAIHDMYKRLSIPSIKDYLLERFQLVHLDYGLYYVIERLAILAMSNQMLMLEWPTLEQLTNVPGKTLRSMERNVLRLLKFNIYPNDYFEQGDHIVD